MEVNDRCVLALACGIDRLYDLLKNRVLGFEANTLLEHLHFLSLDIANIDSEEKAKELGIKVYLGDERSGRFYVSVPDRLNPKNYTLDDVVCMPRHPDWGKFVIKNIDHGEAYIVGLNIKYADWCRLDNLERCKTWETEQTSVS